ncbi:hypothetical protein D3C86_1526960 [compost metagenome]
MPFLLSAFSLISIVCVRSPSSTPVRSVRSDFFSYTCTLLTISDRIFFVMSVGSSPKNSSPSNKTFFTSFPFAVIFPFASMVIPGRTFKRSSTFASFSTLKLPASYSTVSPLITTGIRPVTCASSNSKAAFDNLIDPKDIGSSPTRMSFTKSTY